MSFEVSHFGASPTITTIERDAVSDIGAPVDSTGSSNAHIPPEAPPTSAPLGPSFKKQRLSRGKITKPSNKVHSSPYARGLMSSEEAQQKRNKLGYQRISIACAHCRRRKIRCLLAEEDPHGRCSNCIRLKKECVFYPVDQQAAADHKSHSSSKTGFGTGSSSGVSQSPPDIGAVAFDGGGDAARFPTVPSNVPLEYSDHSIPLSDGGEPTPTEARPFDPWLARVSQPGYQPHSVEPPAPQIAWNGHENYQYHQQGFPATSNDFANPQYWRHNSIAGPSDYAPFPLDSATANTTSTNPFAFTQQRTEPTWAHHQQQQHQQQQPLRSMSYSQVEGYPQQMDPFSTFQQLGNHHQPAFVRPMPPSIDTQSGSFVGHAPHSAPIEQHHLQSLQALSMAHVLA